MFSAVLHFEKKKQKMEHGNKTMDSSSSDFGILKASLPPLTTPRGAPIFPEIYGRITQLICFFPTFHITLTRQFSYIFFFSA